MFNSCFLRDTPAPLQLMRNFVQFIISFAYFGLGAAFADQATPNILFFLADDCSYRDLELYGGAAKTPHLNRLAKEGMLFSRCYQSAPMCSPTRHSLYTGLHPVKNGAYPNHARAYENVFSIPHYLKDKGYRVALAGKTHISPLPVFPFEYLKEFADPSDQEVNLVNGWRYPKVYKLLSETAQTKKPFCLFLCSNEPHGPYTKGDPTPYLNVKLSPQQIELHRDSYAKYLAEITYFDGQVGEVLRMVDQLNLRRDTLIFVATEQGSTFPFGKFTCYEIGVASGLIASWPGKIKANSKSDAIVEYVDVVPTILDVVGAAAPDDLDGRSFLPVLRGQKQTHKSYAYSLQTTLGVNGAQQPYGIRAVVDSRFRYIRNLFPENEFSIPLSRNLISETTSKTENDRLFAQRFFKRPKEELFDVIKDPYCQKNLAHNSQYKKDLDRLSKKLSRWMISQNDKGRITEQEAESRQAEWVKSRKKGSKTP